MADEEIVTTHHNLLRMVTDVVSSYLQKNHVGATQLPEIISSVYLALKGQTQPAPEPEPVRPEPAVPIKRSVTPDFIICLEDGKKLKMLKRHLATAYGMTPEDYRARWGLSSDYPMVAPNYATQRSSLAKQIGLGSRGKAAAQEPAALSAPPPAPPPVPQPAPPSVDAAPKPRRGRRKAAPPAAEAM